MTVHVYGLPDETALRPDEATCDDPTAADAEVVYHVQPTHVVGDTWVCCACGITTDPDTNIKSSLAS